MPVQSASWSVPAKAREYLVKLCQDQRLSLPETIKHRALERVKYVGSDKPFIPISWQFGEAVSALHGLEAAFALALKEERYGQVEDPSKQLETVTIDTDHASLFIISVFISQIKGKPVMHPDNLVAARKYDLADSILNLYRHLCTNIYRTKDDRYYHLHGSMDASPSQDVVGVPHFSDEKDPDKIKKVYADAVAKFDAEELDRLAAMDAKQAGTICFTHQEFLESEAGKAIKDCPIYELSKLGPGQPVPWPRSNSKDSFRPLEGLKVVELTRVIAAPAIGRKLAEYGAQVIRITCDRLPDYGALLVDLGLGKLQANLDLKTEEGKLALRKLLDDADVFLDGYRPGAIEKLGFGPKDFEEMGAKRGKGYVVLRENCFGWHGPWKHRSGWQQISDCFVGISWGFGQRMGVNEPVVPVFPNSDFCVGTIGATGVLHALQRRAQEGGTYLVNVSLSYYNVWLASLGMYPEEVWVQLWSDYERFQFKHSDEMRKTLSTLIPKMFENRPDLKAREDVWMQTKSEPWGGTVTHLRPVCRFSDRSMYFDVPPRPNGFDPPKW
ncbi:CoA-transferase family III [Violaceomyces palustris]|uniref:CoA-transferase family III n=1 Tax=Violaceomyces palustris TaxID=1673888 RepID=A0ACD0P343_9BASI|nr:CoA-transferase family III [Violaceomyces palustris]